MNSNKIPAWFWESLANANKNMDSLVGELENFELTKLQDFWGYHMLASSMLCDYYDGPYIDEEIGHLSEDSTEDLCNFVTSMGYEYWAKVLNQEISLQQAFVDMYASKNGANGELLKWNGSVTIAPFTGYTSTQHIASTMLRKKHAIDIFDVEEEVLSRVGY